MSPFAPTLIDTLCENDAFGPVESYEPKLMALMFVTSVASTRLMDEILSYEEYKRLRPDSERPSDGR